MKERKTIAYKNSLYDELRLVVMLELSGTRYIVFNSCKHDQAWNLVHDWRLQNLSRTVLLDMEVKMQAVE